MANQDEIVRLTFRSDTTEVGKSVRDVDALEAELRQLEAAYERGYYTAQQFQQAQARINAELAAARPVMHSATRAAIASQGQEYTATVNASKATQEYAKRLRDTGSAAVAAGRSHVAGAGGIMLLAQTIDDAQYGFRSIVNNIPMLGTAVGSAMGMGTDTAMKFGGALGLLAVAINLNLKHLDEWKGIAADIGEAMGFDAAALSDVRVQLEGIGAALARVVETASGGKLSFDDLFGEMGRYDAERTQEQGRVSAAERARKAAAGVVDEEQAGRAKAFAGALKGREGGGKAAMDDFVAGRVAAAGLTDEQLEQRVRRPGGGTSTRRELIESQAAGQFGEAMQGDERAIDAVRKQLGIGFQLGYAANLPENVAARKAEEERNREGERAAEEGRRERERRAKDARAAETDMLNTQGGAYQAAAQDEIDALVGRQQAQEAERRRRSARDAANYGGMLEGRVGAEMLAAGRRGVGEEQADEAIRARVERQLARTRVPESRRAEVAEQIVADARRKFDDLRAQQQAVEDVFGAGQGLNERMGGVGPGRMDLMRQQMMNRRRPAGRMAIMARQFAGGGREAIARAVPGEAGGAAGVDPAEKLDRSMGGLGEKLDRLAGTVEKLTQDGVKVDL